MKPLLLILLFILMIFTGFRCTKNNSNSPEKQIDLKIKEVVAKANTPCGSVDSDQSLQWLQEIVRKAEEDKRTKKYSGNYMGKIFLTSYHNQSVFYISMAMGSGGIAAYIFDCDGIAVKIDPSDVGFEQDEQKRTLIYSNVPI